MGGDVFTLRREVGRGDSGAGPLRSRRGKTRPSRELPRVVATPGVQRLLTFRPRVRAWPHTCPSGKTRSFYLRALCPAMMFACRIRLLSPKCDYQIQIREHEINREGTAGRRGGSQNGHVSSAALPTTGDMGYSVLGTAFSQTVSKP